jgi:SAM-dependent methyltransferase
MRDLAELPAGAPELRAVAEALVEVQAHREWVIEGLRAHVANLEAELARLRERVRGLEEHAANLEHDLEGARRHAANLEARLREREARLEALEAHASNLERRVGRRRGRLAEQGILPQVGWPRLQALFRLGERMRAARPDLQRRFPPDRGAEFWVWLLWHGLEGDEEVRKHLYPLPESHLVERVVGEWAGPQSYLRSALVDGWQLDGCLREAGFDPARGGRLLDFGCGCGRVLQYFALYAGSCRLVGADVDAEAVRWCVAHLDFARFRPLEKSPPSPFEAEEFDAVYAFSVFSHLPEEAQRAWLAELARITRPGAALVITVHGRHAVEEIVSGRRAETPGRERLERARPELERRGFAFFPYDRLGFLREENRRFFSDWDLASYGNAFVLEPYVREHWTERFELVSLLEAPDDWQDYVVLRRR